MKKALSLILALVLCLSLCACGAPANETSSSKNNSSAQNNSTPTQPPVTAETVAGTYKSILWFIDETITLNSNTTYTCESDEKGTFSVTSDGKIEFDPTTVTSIRKFQYIDGMLCNTNYWFFEEDEDFGLKFSPDANGRTEQTFESLIIGAELPGATIGWYPANQVWLSLKNDGSFEMKVGQYNSYDYTILNLGTYAGTYVYADSTLTLNYEGQAYPLPVNEAGHILFNSFGSIINVGVRR